MTGRTHDLAAFTALSYIVATQPMPKISLATALVALCANFIGGLAPDIDQPTADLWNRIPAGSIIGRILCPVLGGHRLMSHSFVGIAFFGIILHYVLKVASTVLLVDMNIVWWAFMIGFVSHLLMDMLTRDGVPWLFPLPFSFGIPPFRFMRIRTDSVFEHSVVFPLLLIATGYIYYINYSHVLTFLRHLLK